MQKARLFVVAMLTVCMASVVYAEKKTFTIIHTNDLHSHLLGFSPNIDYTPFRINDDKTLGGWARIATVLHDIRKERENPVLTLDAGDFSMGSLFHMIIREEAVELKLLRERVESYIRCFLQGRHDRFVEFVHVDDATLIGAAIAGLTN